MPYVYGQECDDLMERCEQLIKRDELSVARTLINMFLCILSRQAD